MHARRVRLGTILNDDAAVALTEFAIVIPVVLLTFLALLQYLIVVRSAQLVNYAAYAAARSYAVHAASENPNAAKEMAVKAAAYALAPVARLVPREIFGMGGSLLGGGIPGLLEGYLMARMRLDPAILGGSVQITTTDSPHQVHVEINYPQPIYIPGLAELWNLVAGKKIYYALKDLRQGLGGIPAPFLTSYEGYQELQYEYDQMLARIRAFSPSFNPPRMPNIPAEDILFFPYINLSGNCSMGYEEWGGSLRLPADASSSGPAPLPASDNGADMDEMASKAQQAEQVAQQKAKAYHEAKRDYERATAEVTDAQKEYDSAVTQSQKNAALVKLQAAQRNQSVALGNVTRTKAEYDAAAADARAAEDDLRNVWP